MLINSNLDQSPSVLEQQDLLIGGTALAMHLNPRVSEDLDFAWSELRLPRERVKAIKRVLKIIKKEGRSQTH
jgi:hypothetical protein